MQVDYETFGETAKRLAKKRYDVLPMECPAFVLATTCGGCCASGIGFVRLVFTAF